MMFQPSHRHALALAATLTMLPAAQAGAPTEAQLRSIKLYGDTTIAEDSVERWGFWEQFEPPAAGGSPGSALSIAGSPAALYRPLASGTTPTTTPVTPVTPVTPPAINLPCESGGLCGFGMFTVVEGRLAEPTEQLEKAAASGALPGYHHSYPPDAVSGTENTGTDEGIYPYPYSVTVQPVALGSVDAPAGLADTLLMDDGRGSYYGSYTNANMMEDYRGQAADLAVAWYIGSVREQGESGLYSGIYGVAGRLTPAADMDALNKGQVVATYSGRLMSERYAEVRDNVQLNVNFGNSTFTGVVNGGADTVMLSSQALPNGQTVLTRGVGFTIDARTISGSTFQSTRLRATRGTVSGAVSGGFFGPGAAAAGGIIDINKTRTSADAPYTSGRFVMPFLTRRVDNSEK